MRFLPFVGFGRARPSERWLPVPGYKGRYEVSDHGRVRSLLRGCPRILSLEIGRYDRQGVALLSGDDIASRYLCSGGVDLSRKYPSLWYHPKVPYWRKGENRRTLHPGLLAWFQAPVGGAIRLIPAAERMGIAEGVETAISAAQRFGLLAWAAGDSGNLDKWIPPEVAIFADNDDKFGGIKAATSLAHRLACKGVVKVERVEMPPRIRPPVPRSADWNDILMFELSRKTGGAQ